MRAERTAQLRGGTIPARVGDHSVAPSEIVAGAAASRRGALVTPAGFLAELPNRAPARAGGLNPRAIAHRRSQS